MTGATMLSPLATDLALVTMVLGAVLVAVCCWRSLRRQARGLEIHAHADGTVHEHHRGGVAHVHPTFADRHGRLVARIFGEHRAGKVGDARASARGSHADRPAR